MKKLLYLSMLLFAGACGNQEFEFPDYENNAVYFPLQYPVRTLILGKDRYDNNLDKELKFTIGVVMGGMYKNNQTWTVDYVVDNALAANLKNANGDTIKALPASYYTLSPSGTMVIAPGSFNGSVEVQLTEAFLNDPKSIAGSYVIPIRLTATNADSILSGVPVVKNPDRRVSTDWNSSYLPKDFTLFGIKYINRYHGFYLHRGKDVSYQGSSKLEEVIYRNKFVEKDQIWEIVTSGKNEAIAKGTGVYAGVQYGMKLNFNSNGNIIIGSIATATYQVTGSGEYVVDGGEWGGKKYDAMFLQYEYNKGEIKHVVNDTLVFRNNGVVFEENVVTLMTP